MTAPGIPILVVDDNPTNLLTVNDVVVYIDGLVVPQPGARGAEGADSHPRT